MKTGWKIVTSAARPDIQARLKEFTDPLWPQFMHESPVANRLWRALVDKFGDYQFQLIDESTDEIIAAANCLPLSWNGDLAELPEEGWDWALTQGIDDAVSGRQIATLCALQIVIRQDHRGAGISYRMLDYMKDIGRSRKLRQLLAPVRPNLKPLYPLTPIDRYVTWRREDRSHFDPWLRVHEKAGAKIIKPCHRSMEIPGTVAQWQEWTGLTFQESGDYVIVGALNPITIDRERNLGVYIEPNVWVRHPL